MTQQPFTRRGAIDLSALKRPATPPPGAGQAPGAPAPAAGSPGGSTGAGAYTVQVTAQTLPQVAEASMTAPVLLVVYSGSRSPESATYAEDVSALAEQYDGRFLAGLVDLDTSPEVGQALQIEQVPVLLLLVDGRPATQPIPGVIPGDELSAMLNQLAQQLTTQGVTGRHQPMSAVPVAGDDDEPVADPRYAAAEDALARDDIDTAVIEYQRLVDANPADHEAAAGLAMAKVLQRTAGADRAAATAAADAAPDDVDAQTLVADLDLSEGRVEEAFARLVELVRVTSDKERNKAREHLIGQFAAVGNDDPRVLAARRNLASALF